MYNLYLLKSNLDSRIYIGITKYPEKRYKDHLRYSVRENHYNGNWIRSILNRGGELKMDVIVTGLTTEKAIFLEKSMIKLFRNLKIEVTNTADGGLGFNHRGIPHSEEHRKNIEKSQPHKVRIPKEDLYDLYHIKKLSKKSISKIYGCGITTIDRRLKEYNIDIRVTKNYKVSYKIDKENILNLYLNYNKTISEIANVYKIGKNGIRSLLKREGIDTSRNKSTNHKAVERKYDDEIVNKIKEFTKDNLTLDEISDILNIEKSKITYIRSRYLEKPKKIVFDYNVVKKMYLNDKMCQKEIAEFYKVSKDTIGKYLRLNFGRKNYKKINYQILYNLYVNERMNAKDISKHLNMNYSYICELIYKYKLKIIKKGIFSDKLSENI